MSAQEEGASTEVALPLRLRLYGRRRGRALRLGQRQRRDLLLPQVRLDLPIAPARLDISALFPACSGLALEIGFGAGEHLAFQAVARPHWGFIGCEVFEPGIVRLLALIEERHLDRLRIFPDDARLLIAALAPACLDRVFILHPDPWPKERHKKRRIVSAETLDALALAMKPEAELRLATDDADYAEWIAARADVHPAFARVALAERPADWPATRYEEKALRAGRTAQLFLYRRRS
jgi:tRNA (guanine-N7-)-methyltransferase